MRLLGAWFLVGCGELDGVLETGSSYAPKLHTRYTLSTYVHPGARLEPGAPWVLVLDGDGILRTAAEELDRQVRRGNAEPVLLVGLGDQATRGRDYTTPPELMLDDQFVGSQSGGVEAFFAFVDGVVVPTIEDTHGVGGSPEDRGILGHSLGGLATLWAMTHDSATFRRFGASSPSLWWDAGAPFDWPLPDEVGVRLNVTMGSTEAPPMNVLFEEYVALAADEPRITLSSRCFAGDDHFSVLDRALGDALAALVPAEARP